MKNKIQQYAIYKKYMLNTKILIVLKKKDGEKMQIWILRKLLWLRSYQPIQNWNQRAFSEIEIFQHDQKPYPKGLNVHAPNNKVSKYMKRKMAETNKKIIILFGDLNTALSVIARITRGKSLRLHKIWTTLLKNFT